MGRKLNTFVHVHGPDGQTHVFGPASEVPDWAVDAITAPVWEDDEDDVDGDQEPGSGAVPPRSGKGSGVEAWRVYAAGLDGVALADGATRDEVIAAVEAAGHPVE